MVVYITEVVGASARYVIVEQRAVLMSAKKNVPARDKLVPKLALIFGILFIVGVLLVWGTQTNAFKLATTHQPEPFTELYFNDPTSLPLTITAGTVYAGSFTITNNEHQPMTYEYRTTLTNNDKIVQVTTHSVTVGQGSKTQESFTFTASEPLQVVRVSVELLNKRQSIQFRTES